MEHPKAIVPLASSHPSDGAESELSTLLEDVSQQVQSALQNMLKMTSEIDQSAGDIMEELDKCKETVGMENKILEEERERFQKAALAVLEMLNGNGVI